MRLKITAVAVASAMMMVGSAIAQDAETNVTVKGSVRIGLQYADPGGDADATLVVRNWASRLNLQGDTTIGSGLTAFGRYEFGVDTGSSANDDGALSTRHVYVGLKGDFGQVLTGQTYHTWYNNVIGPVDQPWWGSCNGCVGTTGRTEQAVTYSGSSGLLSGGATLYFGDGGEDILDGFELGATYDIGVAKIGFAVQDFESPVDDPDIAIGLAISGSSGSVTYAANLTSQGAPESGGEDRTGIDLFAALGNAYVDIGAIDQGNTPIGITFGYTRPIGPQTLAWFELQARDPDIDGADTRLDLRAALKYDWE